MDIHEHQAKMILGAAGIPIPRSGVAKSVEEAVEIWHCLGLKAAVVKILIHAGGRGKMGGVKLVKSLEELKTYTKEFIGKKFVNNQTGDKGLICNQVLVCELSSIDKEYYLGATIDRARGEAILIASAAGGMDIEEVAHTQPEKVLKTRIELDGTVQASHLERLASVMGWEGEQAIQGKAIAQILARIFMRYDGALLEINPLISDKRGNLCALDGKLGIDDNALFRQPTIASFYDPTQLSKSEVAAKKFGLEYVELDGNVGCMVNGAGLAMATVDIIDHYGKADQITAANFLDVGGSADEQKVAEAFKIILSDKKVKAIFINIFGGIMSCRTLATGVIEAAKKQGVKVPVIVRFEGSEVEAGKKLLKESGLAIEVADSLEDGAEKAVAAVKNVKG